MPVEKWTDDIPDNLDDLLLEQEMDGWSEESFYYLIEEIRTQDAKDAGILRRVYDGIDYCHARMHLMGQMLKRMIDPAECPDPFLRAKALDVGIPIHIVDLIVPRDKVDVAQSQYDLLRNLCVCAPFLVPWIGTDRGLKRWIMAATGAAPTVIYASQSRPVLGYLTLGSDFCLRSAEPLIRVLVPGWVEETTDNDVIDALIHMNRPYRYKVGWGYLYLRDTFGDSTLAKWTATAGASVVETAGHDFEFV